MKENCAERSLNRQEGMKSGAQEGLPLDGSVATSPMEIDSWYWKQMLEGELMCW